MALTKVRLPVADIAGISNGTSSVDISSSGADILVTAAGVQAASFGDTENTLDVPTSVAELTDVESVDLTVAGGATGILEAVVSSLRLWTTSAHQLVLGANSTVGMTIETDGQVQLAVEGTSDSHLVTKGYVDTQVQAVLSGITAELATAGHVIIPTSDGDLYINWGVTSSLANDASANVSFDEAFPNGAFVAFATCNHGLGGDGGANVTNLSTTGMTIYNVSDTTTPIFWIALGY